MSLKTTPTDKSVHAFLNSVENEQKRKDSFELLEIMKQVTGEEPVMWGDSIIGFGKYQYKYASGREGEWFLVGFSPRKQNLTLYVMSGFEEFEGILENLGKYKTGKSCLYVNKLEDVDRTALKKLVKLSAKHMAESNA